MYSTGGQIQPPGDGGFDGFGILQIDDARGGGEDQSGIGLGEPAEDFEVPEVIALRVDRAFGGEQVERRDAQIRERIDRPDVSPVRGDIGVELLLPRAGRGEQGSGLLRQAGGRPFERRGRMGERRASRGADRRVLLPQKIERLGRPGHQLGIQHQPVAAQLVPEADCASGRRQSSQQLALGFGLGKESAAGEAQKRLSSVLRAQ